MGQRCCSLGTSLEVEFAEPFIDSGQIALALCGWSDSAVGRCKLDLKASVY